MGFCAECGQNRLWARPIKDSLLLQYRPVEWRIASFPWAAVSLFFSTVPGPTRTPFLSTAGEQEPQGLENAAHRGRNSGSVRVIMPACFSGPPFGSNQPTR